MRYLKVFSVTVVLFLTLSVNFSQAKNTEGDPESGKIKNAICAGCHGIDGFRTAYPEVYSVPKIGGQNPVYLANALRAYKNGNRNHPGMMAIASSLSEQDILDLAAYYAQPSE